MSQPSDDTYIGIDLGGTKIEVAVLDAAGRFLLRERRPTPQGDYHGTLRTIADLVAIADRGVRGDRPRPVGVAIPGSISPLTGKVRNANSTVLNGMPLADDLELLLRRPVRLRNDANCLAVSEAHDGAGRGAAMVFAVILGTGVGAGIVAGGREWNGINGIAGEWGHNPLPWPRASTAWGEVPGPACWCGQHGCGETWLSGPGFLRDHARHAGGRPPTDAQALIAAMRAGDPQARASYVRYCDRLARALAQVINLLDPEVIVFGGGMGNVDEIYADVPVRFPAWVFSDTVRTRLVPPVHGDSSGVRGAAWLWQNGAQPRQL